MFASLNLRFIFPTGGNSRTAEQRGQSVDKEKEKLNSWPQRGRGRWKSREAESRWKERMPYSMRPSGEKGVNGEEERRKKKKKQTYRCTKLTALPHERREEK